MLHIATAKILDNLKFLPCIINKPHKFSLLSYMVLCTYVALTCYYLLIMLLLQHGNTPLSSAANQGHSKVIQFLLSKGARGVGVSNTVEL